MSTKDLETKAREIRELKRMRDEIDAELTTLEDEIKAHMTAANTESLIAGEYKISWKAVTSSRFDSARFKKDHAELAAAYSKTTTARRFLVQ